MQPVTLNAVTDVSSWVGRLWWPALRVGGFVLAAPIASETSVPRLVKVVLTLALAFLLAPLVQEPAGLSIFSAAGMLSAVTEVLIGVAIGMVVQVAFESLVFAGQSISLTMGLGFATLVDPQRGAQVPVLGQMFMIFGTLTYLALNGPPDAASARWPTASPWPAHRRRAACRSELPVVNGGAVGRARCLTPAC